MGLLSMVKFIWVKKMFKINIFNLIMPIVIMVKFSMLKPTMAQQEVVKLIILN
jgi:hypothetical protein